MSGAVRVDYAVVLIWLIICSLYTTLLTVTALVVVLILRKRRSSILKSYRPPRAPFSELEFNVATPTDTAKSRRVSFSRRTGVAEFVTNEATTTWKNFYEEHNKTLESSGNDSDVNPPRPSVGHLGKRIFDQQFQEVDANDLLTPDDGGRNVDNSINNENLFRQFNVLESVNDLGAPAPHRKFELSSFTNNQSQIFADEFSVSGLGEVSDRISVNFTDVQLLGRKDDLDDIEKDLKRQSNAGNMVCSSAFRAEDVSEYIEIDLNMTHIAARNDESDMSITDTIHSSEVSVSKIHTDMKSSSAIDCKHWVINKENIAINPYVAPKESANFAINEEPDKILVFDGKRLTIQTELKEKVNRTSVTENASTISLKKAIVLNVDDDLPNFVDNPQASVSHILSNDSHAKSQSMVIGDEVVKIPVSEANVIMPDSLERRRTILYESNAGDISVTQAVPPNIILPETIPFSSDTSKTVVFENEDITPAVSMLSYPSAQAFSLNVIGNPDRFDNNEVLVDRMINIPVTHAVSSNVTLQEYVSSVANMKNIVSASEMENMSMTHGVSENIIFPDNTVPEHRKTIVYESDNDISITQAVPRNLIVVKNRETVLKEPIESVAADQSVKQAMPFNIIPDNAERQDISVSIVPMILTESNKINDHTKSEDISVTQAIKLNTVDHNQEIPKKSALNCNKIGIAIPNLDNVNESKCDLDVSKYTKSNTNIPERKFIAEESDIDVKNKTQPLPASLQLLPEKLITPNDSASSTSLSSLCKETAKNRLSQEMTITEFNNTDKEIEEPQVTIHTHSNLNKIFKTKRLSNLTLTKPIPADLLTIQKILDKSNLSQLLCVGQEKEPINQNFMVYQTSTDMGVIPPVNTEADSILKDPATKDLSRTDLQHNKGQIELFRTKNNLSASLKDMTKSVPNSNYVSKSPSNKSKMSNDPRDSMSLVSNSESQDTNSLSKPVPEASNSPSYQSRFLSETSSQQSKDGNTTKDSKKSLLVDLLDMSYVSVTSGLEDKSATAKIESDNSMNKEIKPNSFENGKSEEKVIKSIESLFYITSGSEDFQSEEDKEVKPKELAPLSIYNKETSDGNCSKNNMMQYLQQKLDQLKDKMPSSRHLEKVVSPDRESYMTEQLLQMLDNFTDVEEQTNPLDEINIAQGQNKFLSIATRNTAGHGSNQKGKKKNKPVTPRTSALHGSPSSMTSPPQVRSISWQGSPVKRGLKKESPLPPRLGSPSFRSLVSPRKSPTAGHGSSLHRHSATRRASSPRKKTTSKKDKKESPTDKDNELYKYTGDSDNELVDKIIEEVSALDEHSSEEYQNEVRKTYLTNYRKELSVEDTTEFIRNKELCDQINEIMNESKETLISNDQLHSPMKGIDSANDIDVPKEKGEDNPVSQPLNEKNLMNEEDISCVLKDATIVKELLYPMEDTNIMDDSNIRKQDTVGKKLLDIENKNTEDTSTLLGLTTRPAISVACSLENLIPKRQSSINPRRQSVVFSKEDLMNNISLAQAILQKELEESPIDVESPESNNYEKKMRINNEVVKSLRFEDDELEVGSESIFGLSTLKSNTSSSPLKKTVFGETSYMNDFKTSQKVNVIPSYLKDVSDGIKQLMSDLMKPDADADVLPFADTKIKKNKELRNVPSTRNTEAQADLFTSSQIDLQREPMSTLESQQSSTTTQQRGIIKVSSNKSVTAAFDMCPPKKALEIIIFDPGNPLNNIYIKPVDFADAHRYEPLYPNGFPDCRSGNSSKDNSIERMFTHYNIRTIRSSFTGTEVNQSYKQKLPEEKNSQVHDFDLMSRRITDCNTLQSLAEVDSSNNNINRSCSVNKAVGAPEVTSRDAKMNTAIAMRDNLKILEAHSSLTLVNEAGDNEAKSDVSVHNFPLNHHDQISGVKVIYEQHNQDLGEMRNDQSPNQIGNTSSSKRKYSSSSNYHRLCTVSSLDITPKPAKKIAKRSTSPDEMLNYDIKTGACQLPPLASRSKNFNTSSCCSPAKHAQIGSCPKSPKDQNNKSPNNKPNTNDDSNSPTGNTKQGRIPLSPKDTSKKQRSTTVHRLAVDGIFNKPNRQQIEPYVEADTVEYIRKQKVEYYVNEISTSSSRSEVTHCASVSTSCGKCTGVTMDWLPELMNELSSKNLVTECESDINVLQMIDALPFMGTPECSWESGDCETWSFYFLHERLRLRIELAPQRKGCNDKGACVRSDTPVLDLKIDNLHQDKRNSVAVVCVKFAAEAMRYLLGRSGVYTRAGDVPALLRRCAGVARVSLKWGRAMHAAWSHLAYTMTEEGLLSLKVANLSLRSVWEVTMQLELVVEDAREVPWPRASDVRVTSIISDHKVTRDEVHRVLHHMKKDWGHVPRTIWKIFRYLKYKTREGDLLLAS
ncbi:uncharacterized protein LOC113226056 [Hyposmocoma kahamanoa]|uniref:uncharacterized protein LOC113226056 n=1 Tax=Hyposmocoma kahamanoa TaxID=1477025 RepID=UPI000E6D8B2A|nr:uncharacterized protein LOC113226056 [Hyposmocoma kahamanoa]